MAVEEVNHERLIQLRREGALRVCEKIGADALLATQHDNVLEPLNVGSPACLVPRRRRAL